MRSTQKIHSGPLVNKWSKHRFDIQRFNPAINGIRVPGSRSGVAALPRRFAG